MSLYVIKSHETFYVKKLNFFGLENINLQTSFVNKHIMRVHFIRNIKNLHFVLYQI